VEWLGRNHRSDSRVGKQFQQQDMGDTAVKNVSPMNTVANRCAATRHLGDHPTGDNSGCDEILEFIWGGLSDQGAGVVHLST
jgi:hypothetical protein